MSADKTKSLVVPAAALDSDMSRQLAQSLFDVLAARIHSGLCPPILEFLAGPIRAVQISTPERAREQLNDTIPKMRSALDLIERLLNEGVL